MHRYLSHAARHCAFAFWPEPWKDIAAPIERLSLSRAQISWLLQRDVAPGQSREDQSGLIADLAEKLPVAVPAAIWVEESATTRIVAQGLPELPGLSRARRALSKPWSRARSRLQDALEREYELTLSVIDFARFPPAGWVRCRLERGQITKAWPQFAFPRSSEDNRRLAASCRKLEPQLQAGAPGGGFLVVDLLVWRDAEDLKAGLGAVGTRERDGTAPNGRLFDPSLSQDFPLSSISLP